MPGDILEKLKGLQRYGVREDWYYDEEKNDEVAYEVFEAMESGPYIKYEDVIALLMELMS
jgi:hypothetical protein